MWNIFSEFCIFLVVSVNPDLIWFLSEMYLMGNSFDWLSDWLDLKKSCNRIVLGFKNRVINQFILIFVEKNDLKYKIWWRAWYLRVHIKSLSRSWLVSLYSKPWNKHVVELSSLFCTTFNLGMIWEKNLKRIQ